ncbi:CHAT domain-containing protein [Winogradskyella sp. HB-48]|uniref:CHAT domain-containing protein n=1 Tax=Winogradskyella sp. HB-48 TaxID=3416808 RepID=UPI003CE6E66E
MYKHKYIALLLLVLVSLFGRLYSQSLHENNLKTLDNFLKNDEYKAAEAFTKKQMDSLIEADKFYELTDYVYYLGQIESKLNNTTSATQVIEDFETRIEALTTNKKALRQLALETGSFYQSIGDSETAKNYNLKALEITKTMPEATGKDLALIESNLGVFYSRLGDLTTATKYHKKGLNSLESDSTSSADSYYISYNSLGGMMWYASKFDSAIYYYKKADKTLKSLEQTPWNKYYRSASLNNNIAGIYSLKGDLDASINAMRTTVNNLNAFLREDISDVRRTHAQEFLFQAVENYAGLYKDIGDYKKAKQLLSYAFQLKNKHHPPQSPEIAKGKVLLGQIEVTLKNYTQAEMLLDEGIRDFINNNGDYDYWLADAYYSKAVIAMELNNKELAKTYFEKSEKYFKASMGNYYDEIYLDFTVNASNFYSEIGNKEKALSMANEALDYIKTNQGEKTLLEYFQVLNLADIYYQNKDYGNALLYSDKALELLISNELVKNSKLNTLNVESNKVSAILTKVKTNLKLNSTKDEAFLKAQLLEIENAIKLLENRKSIISSDTSTSILIQDNIDVFKIAKSLNLELYQLTKNVKYLEALLGYHESMIYHKIRNRLNSKSVQLTANLPTKILEKEKKLKANFNSFLDENTSINAYIENEKKWLNFLNELKEDYPNYYKLRYASISQSLNNLKQNIPESSTVVRYMFIEDMLYAFVVNSTSADMVELKSDNLKSLISQLNSKTEALQPTFQLQSALYNILWKPIENEIKTESIIIIPDKELFNLSFELLTSKICENYKDLSTLSLLAKHTISYNYSLFLIDKNSQPVGYESNFIGFAPEFNEAMKTKYKIAIKDSVELDYSYLKLLPQPFAKDLTKSYSRLFNGNSFLNEKASKSIFTENAKEHKIIHIGTHAESDNISPEFSRLIFAKNTDEENNSLYTYEIYNQNLASNLAILTACETGKPSYQPGEGMISLAHAFNYAGSESILTSLWKIDEQSSTKILEYFYDNISKGMKKDEALKAAKLNYISNADGRTVAPQYWAGLVLIGDTSPIDLQINNNWWIWILSVLIFVAIIFFTFKNKKTDI